MVKKIQKKKISSNIKVSEEKQENKENNVTEPKISKKSKREIQKEEGIEGQNTTGAIYVGHLPWGFEDSNLKKYFAQFGPITRIICPKSSKTGHSVGYAFIEFADEETARIAAKTMNNYILFEKILKCSFVEDKSKYDRIFLKWKKKFEFKDKYIEHCKKLNKKKSNEEIKILVQQMLNNEEKRREKLEELGINYEFKGFKEIVEEYKKSHKKEIEEKNKNKSKEKDKKNKKDAFKDKKTKEKEKKVEKKIENKNKKEEKMEEESEDNEEKKKKKKRKRK